MASTQASISGSYPFSSSCSSMSGKELSNLAGWSALFRSLAFLYAESAVKPAQDVRNPVQCTFIVLVELHCCNCIGYPAYVFMGIFCMLCRMADVSENGFFFRIFPRLFDGQHCFYAMPRMTFSGPKAGFPSQSSNRDTMPAVQRPF